jgi:1-acyl-sn-glycerol-3-phosphate acyltransferase
MSTSLAYRFLKSLGWDIDGQLPDTRKFVLVAAPHTSNWDFMYMYLVAKSLGIPINWMGKEELFKGPMGPVSRALGGIAVRRGQSMNMVQQMAQAFAERDELILAVPPAGTRRKMSHWRSGFYHIALGARVPLTLGFVDYARKEVGIGPVFMPSGNVTTDMDIIRAFYSTITPKYPEEMSEIYLAQELEPDEPTETDASAEMDTETEAEVEVEREAVV